MTEESWDYYDGDTVSPEDYISVISVYHGVVEHFDEWAICFDISTAEPDSEDELATENGIENLVEEAIIELGFGRMYDVGVQSAIMLEDEPSDDGAKSIYQAVHDYVEEKLRGLEDGNKTT